MLEVVLIYGVVDDALQVALVVADAKIERKGVICSHVNLRLERNVDQCVKHSECERDGRGDE